MNYFFTIVRSSLITKTNSHFFFFFLQIGGSKGTRGERKQWSGRGGKRTKSGNSRTEKTTTNGKREFSAERGRKKRRQTLSPPSPSLSPLSPLSQNSVTISLAPPGTTSHATGFPTGSSSPSRASLPCLDESSGRSKRARTLSTTATTRSFEGLETTWVPLSTSDSSLSAASRGTRPLVRTRCREPQSLRTPGAKCVDASSRGRLQQAKRAASSASRRRHGGDTLSLSPPPPPPPPGSSAEAGNESSSGVGSAPGKRREEETEEEEEEAGEAEEEDEVGGGGRRAVPSTTRASSP